MACGELVSATLLAQLQELGAGHDSHRQSGRQHLNNHNAEIWPWKSKDHVVDSGIIPLFAVSRAFRSGG